MKNTNKTKKYSYIVNCDDIEVLADIEPVWALAKHGAGLPITDDELTAIIVRAYELNGPKMTVQICQCTRKKATPWYKRVWNFLTKPFKKNK